MTSALKPLLLAGILASASFVAFSQAPGMGPGGGMMGAGGPMHEDMHYQHMDPARMQARMEQRAAQLKAKLNLTPAQEGAWATFTAAMKPPANMAAQRPDPAEMAKLTTPERIDKMRALSTEHMLAMDKRGDATKAFYAILTPDQQKVFDASAMRQPGPGGRRAGPGSASAPLPPKQ